jgi:glucokinase
MSRTAIVGIDLGGTRVRVGRVVGSTIEAHHARRISGRGEQEVVLEEICQAVDEVLDDAVVGIGCAVPSVVDIERGIVRAVENIPSWREVHLADLLDRRFGLPVAINNDANAFVVGEHLYGVARGYRDVVGLTLGTGLGCGVILEGRLYTGGHCGAGEIGSIPHQGETLEFYCAGSYFPHVAGVSGEEVHRRALAGDAEALAIFDAYGEQLGLGVMVALYAYDPEIVVLGGSIAAAAELFMDGVRRRLRGYDYPHALEDLEIRRGTVEHAAVLGAAALFREAT